MKPIVLLGDTRATNFIIRIKAEGFGVMFVERTPKMHYEGMPWAADNGCFSAWWNKKEWDSGKWIARMDKWSKMGFHPPLFAVVPDLPAQGEKSLQFSRDYLELVPHGWPRALAIQDGMTFQSVKKHLDCYEWLFLGGSDALKVRAGDWVRFARENGKKFHYARASTLEKLEWAKHLEVDSLDSSFPVMDEGTIQPVCDHICPRTSQLCPLPALGGWKL